MRSAMKHSFLRLTVLALAGSISALAQTPQYVLSYFINPNGGQTAITNTNAPNSPVVFPPTNVGNTTTATIVIANNGTVDGVLTSVAASGSTFTISKLSLPAAVKANGNVTFIVSFNPTAHGQANGSLIIGLDAGSQTVALSGQGVGAVLRVDNITASPITTVPANGTLSFPSTAIGKSATITVRITNDGDATPPAFTPVVAGSYFALTNLVQLQLNNLAPGQSTTFNVVFTPTDLGSLTAQLLISNITINLAGTGQGANLTYSPVTNGIILFPNTVAGSTATVTLTITNTGNIATSVTSVGIPASAFSISGTLNLPLTLPPGGTANLVLVFAPNAVGALTSTLGIDNQTFTLRGVGTAPAAIPTFSFVGVGDTAIPLQQPTVGLQLAAPYSQDLTGTLTLTFTPDSFADDPTIQFASGGRTVNFRIPANTTNAVFGQSNQVPFSSGTVAGVITLTPTFSISGVDVTPRPAVVKTILIASSAPVLRSLQIGTRTATSFELLITGYATSRSVSGLQLNFSPAAGSTLSATSVPVNSDSAFSAWYQTAASQTVGSQFTASLTISLSGNGSAVQSVSVSASNSKGSSNSVSVNLQ